MNPYQRDEESCKAFEDFMHRFADEYGAYRLVYMLKTTVEQIDDIFTQENPGQDLDISRFRLDDDRKLD